MSEARRAEFSGGRLGLPVRPSNAANPKGRVVGVASGVQGEMAMHFPLLAVKAKGCVCPARIRPNQSLISIAVFFPAQAGIHWFGVVAGMDPRLRGDDDEGAGMTRESGMTV